MYANKRFYVTFFGITLKPKKLKENLEKMVQLYKNFSPKSYNSLNRNIKISLLIVACIHFLQKYLEEVDKASMEFILCDHLPNSHDHSVL